jgi:hypothetical protein
VKDNHGDERRDRRVRRAREGTSAFGAELKYFGVMDPTLKVFGVGLSRTGTLSLATALNRLGIKTKHFPDDGTTQEELRWGKYNLSILNEFQGLVDIPVAPFYAQLDRLFPSAQFILTTRPTESWLTSLEAHFRYWVEHQRDEYNDFVLACTYGVQHFSLDRMRYVKELHEANVRSYFAGRSEKLLEFNVFQGDGWHELCGFLGCRVPDEPYPRENPGLSSPARVPDPAPVPGRLRRLLRKVRRAGRRLTLGPS